MAFDQSSSVVSLAINDSTGALFTLNTESVKYPEELKSPSETVKVIRVVPF